MNSAQHKADRAVTYRRKTNSVSCSGRFSPTQLHTCAPSTSGEQQNQSHVACHCPPTYSPARTLLRSTVLTKLISVSCRSSNCSLSSEECSGIEGPGEPLGKQKGETCKAVYKNELSISHISWLPCCTQHTGSQHVTKALLGRFSTESQATRSLQGQAPETTPRKIKPPVQVTSYIRNKHFLSAILHTSPQAPHQQENAPGWKQSRVKVSTKHRRTASLSLYRQRHLCLKKPLANLLCNNGELRRACRMHHRVHTAPVRTQCTEKRSPSKTQTDNPWNSLPGTRVSSRCSQQHVVLQLLTHRDASARAGLSQPPCPSQNQGRLLAAPCIPKEVFLPRSASRPPLQLRGLQPAGARPQDGGGGAGALSRPSPGSRAGRGSPASTQHPRGTRPCTLRSRHHKGHGSSTQAARGHNRAAATRLCEHPREG